MGQFVPFKHRRAYFFSMIQNIFWPIFFLHTLSTSASDTVRRLYEKAARTLCRTPKFIDWGTTSAVGGLEAYQDLLVRHTKRKLTHMDARRALYSKRGLPDCDWIYGCFEPLSAGERSPTSYNLRARDSRPTTAYKTKILANQLCEIVGSCDLPNAPWNGQQFETENIFMGDIKELADDFCEPFDCDRKHLINKSVYKRKLKTENDVAAEAVTISNFVESRRTHWNFDPIERTQKFSIQY